MTTLNGSALKEIAHANPTAEAITLALAVRKRFRHVSNLRGMKNSLLKRNEKVVDEDYMRYWKQLEEAGVGSVVHGRKGNPDRFEWNFNLKTVAEAAIQGTNNEVAPFETKKLVAKRSTSKRGPGRPRLSVGKAEAKRKVGRPKKEGFTQIEKKLLKRLLSKLL